MTLETQLSALTQAIKKGRKVTFFVGAGISTSCGIPDFRSPKTGLYANLQRLKLPYPEAVFDIDFFRDDPTAFFTLCDELYPGKFRPSKLHHLMRLLQDKGQLARVYTQNIDTLESVAGVQEEKIVAAHGSFAENHCIDCNSEMDCDTFRTLMEDKTRNKGIPVCGECGGYVKPDIVFFGEGLPTRFFDMWEEDADEVDIAIVAGTSLTVHPFASLPTECNKDSLRVLINNEVVGDFKSSKRKTDVILKDDCDAVVEALVTQLGWDGDLDELISQKGSGGKAAQIQERMQAQDSKNTGVLEKKTLSDEKAKCKEDLKELESKLQGLSVESSKESLSAVQPVKEPHVL